MDSARCLTQLGCLAQDQEQFVEAATFYAQSLALAQKIGFESEAIAAKHYLDILAVKP